MEIDEQDEEDGSATKQQKERYHCQQLPWSKGIIMREKETAMTEGS